MKQWAIQVHKRQTWNNNQYNYGDSKININWNGWVMAMEYEYVTADYFEIYDPESLKFFVDDGLVAAYHSGQWLSVKEVTDAGSETQQA